MLTTHQRAARQRGEKQRRIRMLCSRLDRHVTAAEKSKTGKIRAQHLAQAADAREELRQLDH